MKLHITALSENTAATGGLLAEWGQSILVETDTTTILFDTGQSVSASRNAALLGVDFASIDRIVLSHGHYDHTGGLRDVLRLMRREVEVIAHPDMWTAKYARRKGHPDRYVGIPFYRHDLESLGARFRITKEPMEIAENIMTSGEIPMVTDFESVDKDLFVKEGTGFKADSLLDDQALIIKTDSGLVVIAGCAHRGLINTLYHAQKITGVKEIRMVVGGCHLVGAGEEQLWLTIAGLRELEVGRIGVSHCTGLHAAMIMAHEFGDSFFFNNTGNKINLA